MSSRNDYQTPPASSSMRSLILLANIAIASSGFALPKLGSFRSAPMRRAPAATAFASGPDAPLASKVDVSSLSKTPMDKAARSVLVPALSYAGLGAVAAGAAKVVTTAAVDPSLGMVTVGFIAAPAVILLVEYLFLGGGERVAKMMGGKKADEYLTNLANGVSTKAGLPPPAHVYEIPTNELNAFAAGFGRKDSTVAVTSGLRKALNKKELEAVIAHEIGHIRHSDMSTNMHVAVAIAGLGGVYEVGRFLARSDSGSRKKDKDSDSSAASTGLMLMAGGAVTRVLAHLLQLSMSRTAEYDADRVAAQIVGSDAMISALGKIEAAAKRGPATDSPLRAGRASAFSHAYISSGVTDEVKAKGKEPNALEKAGEAIGGLMRTHPRTQDRIAALREVNVK